MKRNVWLGILLLTLSAVASGSAFGAGGCSLIGSWLGFHDYPGGDGLAYFITQNMGKDERQGNSVVNYPSFDYTLGGFFAAATGGADPRGVWERIDGNTFAYTLVSFGVDASNAALYVAKSYGITTVSEDCNLERITNAWLEVYAPDENPFDPASNPLVPPIPLADHQAYRMYVE